MTLSSKLCKTCSHQTQAITLWNESGPCRKPRHERQHSQGTVHSVIIQGVSKQQEAVPAEVQSMTEQQEAVPAEVEEEPDQAEQPLPGTSSTVTMATEFGQPDQLEYEDYHLDDIDSSGSDSESESDEETEKLTAELVDRYVEEAGFGF